MAGLKNLSKITDEEFRKLASLIHEIAGITLKSSKETLLSNRLGTLVCKKGFTTFTEYYDYIIKTGDEHEISLMLNAVSTNETYFFRNIKHYEALVEHIIPDLLDKGQAPLRIWSAGCSSGEEIYTLAMLLDEKGLLRNDVAIMKASDLNTEVLKEASLGIYPEKRLRAAPERYKMRYFEKLRNSSYKLQQKIRDFVDFDRINLLKTPFTARYEIILCRNVMIYFSREDQEKLVRKFYEVLEPGGYFIIGHSESLFFIKNDFEYLTVGEAPVYQRSKTHWH